MVHSSFRSFTSQHTEQHCTYPGILNLYLRAARYTEVVLPREVLEQWERFRRLGTRKAQDGRRLRGEGGCLFLTLSSPSLSFPFYLRPLAYHSLYTFWLFLDLYLYLYPLPAVLAGSILPRYIS
ncbi:hypothetical protein C8F04DRAFT_151326 [Mycena alexandri]|uniref:Uncharacterized protein n=1 Tax=Mycena alexandri TaxID=1745969 RepID=A0AAD6WRY0_9AGAR|nr:hypothetical protein C8F04DRAFT_151326 [Mycena alexandri]